MKDTTPYAARRAAFRKLHESGCFVIPNPWDAGSARYLESIGFQALATTSSGMAFARGKADMAVGLDEVLAHTRELVEATALPVNCDFEDGHGADLDALAANVKTCVATGVAGISIEDSTGDRARPLYDFGEALERVKAARRAIDETGADVMLIARAECFLTGHADALNEATRRLVAFAEAGADCLYAPGLKTKEEVSAVVKAVAPKPVNVLLSAPGGLTIAQVAELGVRRVSVGGGLARAAWGGFMRAAKALKEGDLSGFAQAAPHGELNALFSSSSRPAPG